MKRCAILDCKNKYRAKGYCATHWNHLHKYGDPLFRKTERHGMTETSEYNTWCKMIARCHSPKDSRYEYYGARDIKVCDRWRNSFLAFYEDMGKRPSLEHSIDRTDNNGNYELENCRWATSSQQALNKRLLRSTISGLRGVTFVRNTGKWRVRLMIDSKLYDFGCYKDKQEAAYIRDSLTYQLYGKDAVYNYGVS